MKCHLLLLFLILSSFLSAQQLFPSPGLVYGVAIYPNEFDFPPGTWFDSSFKYERDTLVCGETLNMFLTSENYPLYLQTNGDQYYQITHSGPCPFKNKQLVHDFSSSVGDTISLFNQNGPFQQIVIEKDTVYLADGKPRRRLFVKETPWWGFETHEIIEGIGYPRFGFFPPIPPFEGQHVDMICVRDSTGILLENPDKDPSLTCESFSCFDPIPKFNQICQGLTFEFVNQSLFASSYHWDFGDGTTSSETNPVHEYATEGCYSVTLVAYTDCQQEPEVVKQMVNAGGIHYWVPPVELPFAFSKSFIRSETHWSFIENMSIHTTHDGGNSWLNYTLPDSISTYLNGVFSIHFSDELNGILAGRPNSQSPQPTGFTTLFKTINGGASWEPLPLSIPHPIFHVYQVAADTAYIMAGQATKIYQTNDGGNNWSIITGTKLWNISGLSIPHPDHIYYCGRTLFPGEVTFGHITNGNAAQEIKILTGGQYGSEYAINISFIDTLHGWIITSQGKVLRTENGGLDWSTHQLQSYDLQDIQFENTQHGLIVGSHGLILESFDGGITWDSTYCHYDEMSNTSNLYWPKDTDPFITDRYHIYQLSDTPVQIDCQTVAIDPVINTTQALTIFPNPVGDSRLVQIHYPELAGGELTLFNTSGQLVLTQAVLPSDQTRLDCSVLAPGVYVVRLTSNNGRMLINKLIIH